MQINNVIEAIRGNTYMIAIPNIRTLYIRPLWKGEIPLWQSFWVFGVVGMITLYLGLNLLSLVFEGPPNARSHFAYAVIALSGVFSLAYLVLVLFGIWRSATRYPGNKVWAYISKFVVVGVASIYAYSLGPPRIIFLIIVVLIPLTAIGASVTFYHKYVRASDGFDVLFVLFLIGLLAVSIVAGLHGIESGTEYYCSHGGGNLCGLGGYFVAGPLAFSVAAIVYTLLWFVCLLAFKAVKPSH
jgi:hypothetical protein